MSHLSQSTLALLTVALAVFLWVLFGADGGSVLVLLVGGFALYWRSGKFRWSVVLWIVGTLVALVVIAAIAFVTMFAGLGSAGWEY